MSFAIYPSLKDKRVVITGGASGIGSSIVSAFAAQGAKVAFLDVLEEEGRALARELKGSAHSPVLHLCDLRDLDAASDQPFVFNYVNDGSTLNIADLRNDATTSSVICPSLLLDSVELMRAENEAGAAPIVPPPSLAAER